MLRILYMLARLSLVLRLKKPDAADVLEREWRARGQDDDRIMDHSSVVSNETLLTVQELQKLTPAQREYAELYFLGGISIETIAQCLGVSEAVIREAIDQMLRRLGGRDWQEGVR